MAAPVPPLGVGAAARPRNDSRTGHSIPYGRRAAYGKRARATGALSYGRMGAVELRILAAPTEQQALLDLPWDIPLEEWPEWYLVALPRGISRHVVRFTRLGGRVYALKEVVESYARKEYRLLRDLERLDVPAVEAVGIVTGREAPDGTPLDPVLVTRHLQFSLPYRALFCR